MKLDDLDLLIVDLAEESVSGPSDEYAQGLMANASAVLDRYRTSCRLSSAIGIVLEQARVVCEATVLTTEMVNLLREKGLRMRKAEREHLVTLNAADVHELRETPEDMAIRFIDIFILGTDDKGEVDVARYIATAIRKDRLETEVRK